MEFPIYFPVWDKLTDAQKSTLLHAAALRSASKGTVLHDGTTGCTGLLLLCSGQLRAYILSDEGREITIYRLFDGDFCLFSASCVMNSIQFDITIEAEKESQFWVIPPDIYKELMAQSVAVANYTNEVMASRFSEVVWLIEQILWKSFDKRLAAFLLEECVVEDSSKLSMTHEAIANHLGSAREVVTRMLRYFQSEGLVRVSRGVIEVLDERRLRALSDS